MRKTIPYFLLFAIYAVVNTYLPLMLRTLGYSNSEVGMLLGIIEAAGFIIPFFIIPALDKSGQYGTVMLLLGLDMAFLLYPITRYASFFAAALSLGIFAVGLKGLVPILDGFTAKVLGNNNAGYGRIRAVGSIGFVCTSLFLQFSTLVSGKNSFSVIVAISVLSILFTLSLLIIPEIYNKNMLCVPEPAADGHAAKTDKAFPPVFWFSLFIMFLAFMGLVPCQRFFSLYMQEYLHSNAAAALWALAGVMEIPVMVLSGKLMRRFGTEKLLIVCLASLTARNISYILFPGLAGAIIGQALHAVSFGLFHPVSIVVCASYSSGKTAAAMIFFNAANGVANVLGSVMGGYIIQYAGYPALFLTFSLFPAAGIVLYMFKKRIRTAPVIP